MSQTLSQAAWTGPFRSPRNMAAEVKGSIHDDATAARLGFRGGTVAGSIHMDQFVPRLLELYGPGWFETGGLSLYFTQATVDREEVQASVSDGAPRALLSMRNRDGALICEGTAAPTPDEAAAFAARMARQAPAEAGRLRILAALQVDEEGEAAVRLEPEALERHLAIITERVAAYAEGALPPSQAVALAHQARAAAVGKAAQPHVGLFGALEVQHLAGPLKAGVEYRARTKVLKLTESPKTENCWHEVVLAAGGRDVARVLFYLRFLKGSSPLWS